MKILKEMETGYGTGKWILADMGDEFYGYGTPTDFKSIYGLPVNQCGSRAEVIESLSSRASCCKKPLSKYQMEFKKSFSEGWKQLMLIEEKELEILLTFVRTLRGNETEAASVRESLTIKLNGRMYKICVPTDESQLNKLLGDQRSVFVADWEGPYPILDNYVDIRKINQDFREINAQGLEEGEVRALFQASDLSGEETAEKILKGEYFLLELGADTDSWTMGLKQKAALAICSSYQAIPALAEAFEANGGEIPDELIGYIDWDRVWRECVLAGWKLVRDNRTGTYWVCNL